MSFSGNVTIGLALILFGTTPSLAQSALSLDDAIARAMAADPILTARTSARDADRARADQARSRPNPELGLELENAFGTGPFGGTGSSELTADFSQRFELGGDRRARITEATAAIEVADATLSAAERALSERVTQDFVALLGAEQRLKVAESRVALTRRLLPTLRRRVEAGASPPVDVLRGEVAVRLAEIETTSAQATAASARRQLASNWRGDESDAAELSGTLDVPGGRPRSLADLAEALADHPRLKQWESEVARRQAVIDQEKAERIPDVTVGAGVRQFQDTDDTAVVLSASLPLPLWNRNTGAIAAARYKTAEAEAERDAVRLQLYRDLNTAYGAMNAACDEARQLNRAVLPEAQRTLSSIEAGYDQGRFDALDLLEASTLVSETQSLYADRAVACGQARATVKALAGHDPWSRP